MVQIIYIFLIVWNLSGLTTYFFYTSYDSTSFYLLHLLHYHWKNYECQISLTPPTPPPPQKKRKTFINILKRVVSNIDPSDTPERRISNILQLL